MSRTSFWQINILKLLHQPHQSAEAPPTQTSFLPQTHHKRSEQLHQWWRPKTKLANKVTLIFLSGPQNLTFAWLKTSWRERSWLCHLNNSLILCCPWLLVKQNQKHEDWEVNQTKPKKFPCRPWIWVFIKLIS